LVRGLGLQLQTFSDYSPTIPNSFKSELNIEVGSLWKAIFDGLLLHLLQGRRNW
jgi:hypothetical protein